MPCEDCHSLNMYVEPAPACPHGPNPGPGAPSRQPAPACPSGGRARRSHAKVAKLIRTGNCRGKHFFTAPGSHAPTAATRPRGARGKRGEQPCETYRLALRHMPFAGQIRPMPTMAGFPSHLHFSFTKRPASPTIPYRVAALWLKSAAEGAYTAMPHSRPHTKRPACAHPPTGHRGAGGPAGCRG